MGQAEQSWEVRLQDDLTRFVNDPYGFVMYAYPWGEPGTALEHETGPDPWQEKILRDIGHALTHGWVWNNGMKKDCSTGIFFSVRSGHGIGKSALMAMLDQWFITVHPHPQIVTTANTQEQLNSKTWREQAKWWKLLINRHWFKWQATKFYCVLDETTWASRAIPWSERNAEAFAGTHEKAVLIKYDEASGIPPIIWETTEGAMTESSGVKIWIVFGNPTQPVGRFAECFKKYRSLWCTYEIDARTSKRTDHKLIAKWAEMYGEDSDFFRVRVKGQEPRSGTTQFIGNETAELAKGRIIHLSEYYNRSKILGVDIARFGDDQTVFITRQGLAAYDLQKYRNLKTQNTAGLIAQAIDKHNYDMVFLDMGNIGASVYDLLDAWGYQDVVTGVWFGSKADDPKAYYLKRSEMWGKMRDWLEAGGCYPDDNELRDDLIGPEYGFTTACAIQLEAKDDMKARGLASPDCADALALTFAYHVAPRETRKRIRREQQAQVDYDVLNHDIRPKQRDGRVHMALTDYNVLGGRVQ